MKNKKKKNIVKLLLISMFLLLGVGYAMLTSSLNINGVSNINNSTWNIYWNNVEIKEGSVTDVITPARIKSGNTEVEFNVTLNQPGDYYEFTVDAVNDGSIDAMIGDFSKGVYEINGNTTKALPDYLEYMVTYNDGMNIDKKHILPAGQVEKYKVRVYFKDDIDATQLPSVEESYLFKFEVNYVQADSSAIQKNTARNILTNPSNVVTSGDGLYETNPGIYYFRGDVNNNYITFNDETWRIVGINDSGIKIIKNTCLPTSYSYSDYDSTRIRDGYCAGSMPFCNAWAATDNLIGKPSIFANSQNSGIVRYDSTLKIYLNEDYYINDLKENHNIVDGIFNVGPVDHEEEYKWMGKVGLLTKSEFNQSVVNNKSFLSFNTSFWCITPSNNDNYNSISFYNSASGGSTSTTSNQRAIFPVVYLNSNIILEGEGTSGNPYIIVE